MYIQVESNGFQIILENREILFSHSEKSPMIYLGSGSNISADEYPHPNSYVQERLALRYHRIVSNNKESWQVYLSHREDFKESFMVRGSLHEGTSAQIYLSSTYRASQYNRYWINFHGVAGEQLYGAGQHSEFVNLKNHYHSIFLQDDYLRKLSRHQPLRLFRQSGFLTSRRYAVLVDGDEAAWLNAVYDDFIEMEFWMQPRRIFVTYGYSMPELLSYQSRFWPGNLKPIPDWMIAQPIVGRFGNIAKITQGVEQVKGYNIPVGAVWLQDWAQSTFPTFGARFGWNWICADEFFEPLKKGIKQLKDQGHEVIAYLNGLLTEGSRLYNEADEQDFLIRKADGDVYLFTISEFSLGMIDLTNEEAKAWFVEVIKSYLIDLGIKGWLLDAGSNLPLDAILSNGTPARVKHLYWPQLLIEVAQEAIKKYGDDEYALLSSSGWAGTQSDAHAIMQVRSLLTLEKEWSLQKMMRATLSGGISGYGMQASILGLYAGEGITSELIIRHLEILMFMPILWLHEPESDMHDFNFYDNAQILKYLPTLTKIFTMLHPYRKHLLESYRQYGMPFNRPMFVDLEQDSTTYHLEDQMMFGSDIMVAPILEAGATSRRIYFPAGRWQHFGSSTMYEGPYWQDVEAPLGATLAFYRFGTEWLELFLEIRAELKNFLS